jgi:hypothetical protein
MAASGVTNRSDPVELKVELARMIAKRVCRAGDIFKRPRIAATGFIYATILDVPDREPFLAEVIRCEIHQSPVRNRLLPASTMHHDHDRVRPGAIRQPEINNVGF